ncbi:nuclear transport factor 2 family protein [Pendulispora rubella]|uniref:Nuclear transport factor 2 family protein n=1 Tax=Pendulispora rubella TaxID=2741070 RepID=A0ABZ2KWS3_9BACT
MKRFRQAVEASDIEALVQSLSPDVVFHSPVRFHAFEGRETVGTVLRAVMRVFKDFHYTNELHGGGETALVFRAKVGTLELEGIDLLTADPSTDLVTHLTVFVRPLSAAQALAAAVGKELGLTS